MNERIPMLACLIAGLLLGCTGGGNGDGGGGAGGLDDGGAGGTGGTGGTGGVAPGQCGPSDPGGLVAIFDAVAAAGGGTPAQPDQVNCATACGVLSSCLQSACGVAEDPTAVAVSVNACLMACSSRTAAAVGAVLGATGMATCTGVDERYCGDWFDPACEGGAGGSGGMGGVGGMGGAGGDPDYTDCDPAAWCPATACILDCDTPECARACAETHCGADGAACRGCPDGAARPVCDFCAANGQPDICGCDLEVVCESVRCGMGCGDGDDACREACSRPCLPRAGWPCACTAGEVASCVQ